MRTIPFGRPIIKEEEKKAVLEVLSGSVLVHGPRAEEFEEKFTNFTGGGYAVSVSSCTAALHLSYFYLGLKPKEEVIVPAQTHVATAHAVEFCGAKPVFIDAEERTGNIDINQIEKNINRRTRAISIVHFLGMPVDMQRINKIAAKHNLFVVEDCALAVGIILKAGMPAYTEMSGVFHFIRLSTLPPAKEACCLPSIKNSAKDIKAESIRRRQACG